MKSGRPTNFLKIEKNLREQCNDGNLEVLNLNSKNFPVRLRYMHMIMDFFI